MYTYIHINAYVHICMFMSTDRDRFVPVHVHTHTYRVYNFILTPCVCVTCAYASMYIWKLWNQCRAM